MTNPLNSYSDTVYSEAPIVGQTSNRPDHKLPKMSRPDSCKDCIILLLEIFIILNLYSHIEPGTKHPRMSKKQ